MFKLYCLLTGDDYNLVKNETPDSKKKIKLLGMLMLLPVMLWVIQGFLVSLNILKVGPEFSLLISLASGIIIFIIERSIVMSNGGKGIIITRIAMGFLIALIGALVFDEVLFRHDIEKQLEKNIRNENALELKSWTELNMQKILTQETQTDKAFKEKENERNNFNDEINGTYRSSGRRGVGKVANEKKGLLIIAEQNYYREKSKLDSMRSSFEREKIEFMNKLESQNTDGLLLHRMKAMFDLIFTENILMIVFGAFTFLFLLIEVTVVIVKMSHKKTNYERMNELKEKIGESRIERILKKEPDNFKAESLHPDVIRLNNHLKKNVPGIF